MVKFLLGVLVSSLAFGMFFLGSSMKLGGISGNQVTVPFLFEDTVEFNGGTTISGEIVLDSSNCASRTNVVIPAISGRGTQAASTFNATSVTLTQVAVGDLVFASWNSATGTLDALGLQMTAHASTSEVRVVFDNPSFGTSSANNIGTLRVCSIDV